MLPSNNLMGLDALKEPPFSEKLGLLEEDAAFLESGRQ
jgi:hypothetical protein